jgi:hypothetical protein
MSCNYKYRSRAILWANKSIYNELRDWAFPINSVELNGFTKLAIKLDKKPQSFIYAMVYKICVGLLLGYKYYVDCWVWRYLCN